MIAAAARKEINDMVAKWPPMPALDFATVANDNSDDAVRALNQRIDVNERDTQRWRSLTLAIVEFVEAIAVRVAEGNSDLSAHDMALAMAPILQTIHTEMDTVDSFRGESVLGSMGRNIATNGNLPSRETLALLARRYEYLVAQRLAMLAEIKDRISAVIWDLDPDAHGGPAFANPDDLISFLES